MATNIYNYNGTLATTIADGAIDTTTSIAMPGRGYLNYGEPVNQDMLWIMQNFANSSSPTNPTTGQLWYNTGTNVLSVWSGTAWLASSGALISGTTPGPATSQGALWFNSTTQQLFVWSGAAWIVTGPLGSPAGLDPAGNTGWPGYSALTAVRITDSSSAVHAAWELTVGSVLLAIISGTSTAYTPLPAISGFTSIQPGINFSTNVPNAGVISTNGFTNNQNNLPATTNTYNLGSPTDVFANVYATNFIATTSVQVSAGTITASGNITTTAGVFSGKATSAEYADVAERYAADMPLDPGTVVCLGGTAEVTACVTMGTDDVFGVVSTDPAYLMNSTAGDDRTHPAIAFLGRVPCKVAGPVKKGQRLMASSVSGCACAYEANFGILSIIGRSLVDKDTSGIDTIEVVIGRN